jgi:hypothetical protein
MGQNKNPTRRTTPEFWLVVIMLFTMTTLVIIILHFNINIPSGVEPPKANELLDYRKSILTIIITAFGAWVSAGASYFFGRENLRLATESLLQMHQPPAERFKQMPVQSLPRKPVDWTVKNSDTIESVSKRINRKKRWFIPIVKDDGTLENVIHEDAVWLFIDNQSSKNVPHAEIIQKTVADVVAYIRSESELKAEFDDIYVRVSLDDKAGEIHDAMMRKDVYLGIVTDAKGKPTEFITTADMRIFLLQSP